MLPGKTEFTVIPSRATSRTTERITPVMAALVAPYAE